MCSGRERVLLPAAGSAGPHRCTATGAARVAPAVDRARSAAVPLLASVVPVVGAVALWAVTGSILALWLAALGPLIAGASMLDGARSSRREKRRAERAASIARAQVGHDIDERHADERERLRARHPDLAGFADRPAEVWRVVPGRAEALVLGRGERPSALRVTGGGDDPASADLRRRASLLASAPVAVPLPSDSRCRRPAGARPRGRPRRRAPARPDQSTGSPPRRRPPPCENAWAECFRTDARPRASGSPRGAGGGDCTRRRRHDHPDPNRGSAARRGCRAHGAHAGRCRTGRRRRGRAGRRGGDRRSAGATAGDLARAPAGDEGREEGRVAVIALAGLLLDAPPSVPGRLCAPVGLEADEPCVIDLVDDGPHAIVAGVTGSGKSELLITWVLALSARHPPGEVSFLLADFKGGTAFDALAGVPHVTGVITDLDGTGARRAIESLRAEVRWRERSSRGSARATSATPGFGFPARDRRGRVRGAAGRAPRTACGLHRRRPRGAARSGCTSSWARSDRRG